MELPRDATSGRAVEIPAHALAKRGRTGLCGTRGEPDVDATEHQDDLG